MPLQNSYQSLPTIFFAPQNPEYSDNPECILYNPDLAKKLEISKILSPKNAHNLLSGNTLPEYSVKRKWKNSVLEMRRRTCNDEGYAERIPDEWSDARTRDCYKQKSRSRKNLKRCVSWYYPRMSYSHANHELTYQSLNLWVCKVIWN